MKKLLNLALLIFFSQFFCGSYLCGAENRFGFVGFFGDKGVQEGEFEEPAGISVDINGCIYIADAGNHRIQKFSERGNFIEYRGGLGWSGENFDKPVDIFAKSVLDIFVTDQNAHRIVRFDKDLNYISSLGLNDISNNELVFGYPSGISVSRRGDIFVVDGENKRIIKINSFGEPEMSFGGFENLDFGLNEPFQVAVSSDNNIFVSDFSSGRVLVFDYFGNFSFEIFNKKMKSAAGIDIDNYGRVFIADPMSASVYVFNLKGLYLFTITGNEIGGGEIFKEPIDIVFYKGLLYVLDRSQKRVYILKEKN